MAAGMTEPASAKLNLYLHLTGKRADGYHLLDSLFTFIDLQDELSVKASDKLSLSVKGSFADLAGDVENNTVLKAAKLMQEATGCTKGAALTLTKNIPPGAGLGGGSADAAAAIRLLTQFWKLKMPYKTMHAIALQVGADVPACLTSNTVQVSGVGETLAAGVVLLQPLHLLLVYPNKALATAEVYKQFKGPFSEALPVPGIQTTRTMIKALAKRKNDLEAPAIALMPEIEGILTTLRAQEGCGLARMTGSGSACFGLFEQEAQCEAAAKAFPTRYWVKKVKTAT